MNIWTILARLERVNISIRSLRLYLIRLQQKTESNITEIIIG